MKNIGIFCDGTWQNLSQRYPTNVACLARSVSPMQHAAGRAQVVYYDDGVGVPDGMFSQATKLLGGGMGIGLDHKISQAYEFLCLNYVPGDCIYIFGFSRGAYTARSLAGLLRKCWILRRDQLTHLDEAVAHYRSGELENPLLAKFKQDHCYAAEAFRTSRTADPLQTAQNLDSATDAHVQYVGVWDTVGALGIPNTLPFSDVVDAKYRFHDESLSRFVVSARHAMSIDERRATFSPTLWNNIDQLNANAGANTLARDKRPYQQIWFPGHHSEVGGGEDDGGLSKSPLLWIAQGAANAGLDWVDDSLAVFKAAANPLAPFVKEVLSLSSEAIALMGEADRGGPDKFEDISEEAQRRWSHGPDYRPHPLERFTAQLNDTPRKLQ